MSSGNKLADELKALEGVRERMSKYNEALKKKNVPEKKQKPIVGTLDESKKDITGYLSPSKDVKKKITLSASQIGSLPTTVLSTFEALATKISTKEERDKEELLAKEELGKLLETKLVGTNVTAEEEKHVLDPLSEDPPPPSSPNPTTSKVDDFNEGNSRSEITDSPIVQIIAHCRTPTARRKPSIRAHNFQSIRTKYMAAIAECKPRLGHSTKEEETSPPTTPTSISNRKVQRKTEAKKKDRFVQLRHAWDRYEISAQDKPKLSAPGETEIRRQIFKTEDEVVDTWVDYAKTVVKEIMVEMDEKEKKGIVGSGKEHDNDNDDDDESDDDMEYWIREAKRLKAEAEERKRAKEEYFRQQIELEAKQEEEYWMVEALRLKELNSGKKRTKMKKNSDSQNEDNISKEEGEELVNPYDDSVDIMAIAAATRKATKALYSSRQSSRSPSRNIISNKINSSSTNASTSPRMYGPKITSQPQMQQPKVPGVQGENTPPWVKNSSMTTSAERSTASAFLKKSIIDVDDLGHKQKKKKNVGTSGVNDDDDSEDDEYEEEELNNIDNTIDDKKGEGKSKSRKSYTNESDVNQPKILKKKFGQGLQQFTDDNHNEGNILGEDDMGPEPSTCVVGVSGDVTGDVTGVRPKKKEFLDNEACEIVKKKKYQVNQSNHELDSDVEDEEDNIYGEMGKNTDTNNTASRKKIIGDEKGLGVGVKILKKQYGQGIAFRDEDDNSDADGEERLASNDENTKRHGVRTKKKFVDDVNDDLIYQKAKKKESVRVDVKESSDDESNNSGGKLSPNEKASLHGRGGNRFKFVDSNDNDDLKKRKKKVIPILGDGCDDDESSNHYVSNESEVSTRHDKMTNIQVKDDINSNLNEKKNKDLLKVNGADSDSDTEKQIKEGSNIGLQSKKKKHFKDNDNCTKERKKTSCSPHVDSDDVIENSESESSANSDDSSSSSSYESTSSDTSSSGMDQNIGYNTVRKNSKKELIDDDNSEVGQKVKKKNLTKLGTNDDFSSQTDSCDENDKPKKPHSKAKAKVPSKGFGADIESSLSEESNSNKDDNAKVNKNIRKKKSKSHEKGHTKSKKKIMSSDNLCGNSSSDSDNDEEANNLRARKKNSLKVIDLDSDEGVGVKKTKKSMISKADYSSEDNELHSQQSNKSHKPKPEHPESDNVKVKKKKTLLNNNDSSGNSEDEDIIQSSSIPNSKIDVKSRRKKVIDSDSESNIPERKGKKKVTGSQLLDDSSSEEIYEISNLSPKSSIKHSKILKSISDESDDAAKRKLKKKLALSGNDDSDDSSRAGHTASPEELKSSPNQKLKRREAVITDTGSSLYDNDNEYEYQSGTRKNMSSKGSSHNVSRKKQSHDKSQSEIKKKPKGSSLTMIHNESSSQSCDDEQAPKNKGKAMSSRTTKHRGKVAKSLGEINDNEYLKNAKPHLSKNSLDDSNSDDNGSPSYMKKYSSGDYDFCDDASMSDTVPTDDESVNKKKSNVVVPFQRRKSINLNDQAEILEQKARNLDGSRWKYTLSHWLNKPRDEIEIHQTQISMKIPSGTDLWRKTRYNFVEESAPFHYQEVSLNEFEVMVNISGNFSSNYQKGGLLIRIDKSNWLFMGMEYFDGRVHLSNIATCDYSDRTLLPLPLNAELAGVWLCFKVNSRSYESYYSFDGKIWKLCRQGFIALGPSTSIGIVGASPLCDDLITRFDYYRCTSHAGETLSLQFY